MVPYQHASSLCDEITIKHEPVVAESHIPQEGEIEYISVKEEAVEWEEPDDEDSMRDPLSIDKQGFSASDYVPLPEKVITDETEDEELDEAAASEDNVLEIKHCIESASSGSEVKGSIPIGMEDNKSDDNKSELVTNVSPASPTGNTNQEETFQKKTGVQHLSHRRATRKRTPSHSQAHAHLFSQQLFYSCYLCHKTFTCSRSLKRHTVVHTGERPFICGICNKKFTQNSSLKWHSQLHIEERPYSCDVCHQSFSRMTYTMEHARIHTSEQPYCCRICQNKFTHFSSCKRHLLIHMKEC